MTGTPGPLSLLEYELWGHYRQRYGFEVDRLEGVGATGASAVCHAWGAKIAPADIIPKFGSAAPSKRKLLLQLSSLKGAKVEFLPRDGSPALVGSAAMAKLDDDDSAGSSSRMTLDGPRRPKPHRRGGTLSGD